jgi:hypothetical protein
VKLQTPQMSLPSRWMYLQELVPTRLEYETRHLPRVREIELE